MDNMAVRTYTRLLKPKTIKAIKEGVPQPLFSPRALFFDTESRVNCAQPLTVGYAVVYEHFILVRECFFYDTVTLTKKELEIVRTYSKERNIEAITVQEFIRDYLIYELQEKKTLCAAYNLAFDVGASWCILWRGQV